MADPISPLIAMQLIGGAPRKPEDADVDDAKEGSDDESGYRPIPVSHDPFEVIEI